MQMRCLCWNEQTKEARSDCQTCFGTGYLLKFERHKCRDFRTTDNFIASRFSSLQQELCLSQLSISTLKTVKYILQYVYSHR